MAEETLLPSADSVNNWDAGTFADVNQGVDTPNDGLTMSDISIEGEIVTFDMDNSALSDGDTITNVTIRTRAQRGSNNGDSLGIDLLIGGSVQGSQVNRTLGTSLDDINSNDVGWNTDWTAAQLDGLQVRLTTLQTGMPGTVDITVSEVEVLITYTPDAGTLTSNGTPTIEEITVSGVSTIIKKSNGTPLIAEITASGISTIIKKTIGTVVVAAVIAAGVSTIIKPSSGNPALEVITASGTASAVSPTNEQDHYRWYADDNADVDLTTALADEDTPYNIPVADLDKSHHLRIVHSNTGSGIADANFGLRANVDGSGFDPVSTSSLEVRTIAGLPANSDPTSQRLTSGTGSFITGQYDDNNTETGIDVDVGEFTESVFSIQFRSADLSGGESIVINLSYDGISVDTFNVTIEVTIGLITANGTPSINSPTAAGIANLAPKVWLNTSQILSGATEMTVTAYNSAGTSITFNDPASPPVGALFLGVENRNLGGGDSNTGWIAVTVGGSRQASGTVNVLEITASGVSILGGALTSTGTSSTEEITAAGVSTKIQKASGTLSLDEITAVGQSTQTLKPSGALSLDEIEASGSAKIIKKSDGTPSIAEITASGVVDQIQKLSGTPSIEVVSASGVSIIIKKGSGSPILEEIEATGQSSQTLKPSGTPSIAEITASGESGFLRDGSGTITLPEIAASGVSALQGEATSFGNPLIEEIQASGNVIQRQFLSGAASIDEIVAAGISTILKRASGAITVDEILAAGVVDQIQKLSGAPSIEVVSASGVSRIIKKSFGALTLSEIVASGVSAFVGDTLTASGTLVLEEIGASGVSVQTLKPSGTPSIDEIIATGIAKIIKKASGTPAIDSPTALGVAGSPAPKVWLNTTQVLAGATEMTVTSFNGAGTLITFTDPIGAPTGSLFLGVENKNAGGGDSNTGWIAVTVNIAGLRTSNGTPSIDAITASGVANLSGIRTASGTPSIDVITVNGLSNLFGGTEGFPSIAEITASGVSVIQPEASFGDPSIEEITAAGIVIQTQKLSGAVTTKEITASGVSISFGPESPSSGTPSIVEIEAFGISTIVIDPVEIRTPTTSYSGKIDLDLARPGDIEDPATDRAINFLHDAVEQLSLSVITEFESIVHGYGGIKQTGTPSLSDLGAGFQVVPADAELITTPIEVTQDFANDGIIVERSGVWSIGIIISLSHNEDAAVRTTEIQLYNDNDAAELSAILVPIARNQPRTFISLILMVEIPESAKDDLLQIRIGNGSTVTSVILEAYQFSVNYISEFNA